MIGVVVPDGVSSIPEDMLLDWFVDCAPCARLHIHMRNCPYARAWQCEQCSAQRFTAAAIVAHVKRHVETKAV